jgi:stage V sporulation protein B
MSSAELLTRLTGLENGSLHGMLFFGLIWGMVYFAAFCALGNVKLISKSGEALFGKNAQQTSERIL